MTEYREDLPALPNLAEVPAPVGEPEKTTKHVYLQLKVIFHGDYVRSADVMKYLARWLESGLADRADLREWEVRGHDIFEIQGDTMGYES